MYDGWVWISLQFVHLEPTHRPCSHLEPTHHPRCGFRIPRTKVVVRWEGRGSFSFAAATAACACAEGAEASTCLLTAASPWLGTWSEVRDVRDVRDDVRDDDIM
jgi:hypothetical protein